jgi:hypothetical protein
MAKATAGDAPDWFTPPSDVQKVTICRVSGQLATDACRHNWIDPGYAQAGLTSLPGSIADAAPTPAAPQRPNVYDDYFPYGTAPTTPCEIHGAPSIPGITGIADAAPADGGVLGASYRPASYSTGSRLQKVIGADGRAVWVIR